MTEYRAVGVGYFKDDLRPLFGPDTEWRRGATTSAEKTLPASLVLDPTSVNPDAVAVVVQGVRVGWMPEGTPRAWAGHQVTTRIWVRLDLHDAVNHAIVRIDLPV